VAGRSSWGHEDDRPNTQGFPLRSIQSIYFDTFLPYKPERLQLDLTDDDLEIALRALSSAVAPLAEFTVLIEDAKVEKYLQTTKLGKLQKAGLTELTKAELETAIRSKLRMNYLYNLEWVSQPTHQLRKFNILLEFPRVGGHPECVVVALEFRPVDRIVRLVTITRLRRASEHGLTIVIILSLIYLNSASLKFWRRVICSQNCI
jgi:hypothetical protein